MEAQQMKGYTDSVLQEEIGNIFMKLNSVKYEVHNYETRSYLVKLIEGFDPDEAVKAEDVTSQQDLDNFTLRLMVYILEYAFEIIYTYNPDKNSTDFIVREYHSCR